MLTNLFVEKGDTKTDTDLIYMMPLHRVLKKVLDWYFDNPKSILDVTAGEQKSWHHTSLHNTSILTGEKLWNVVFLDISQDAKTDLVADFRQLPFPDNSFDIIYFDAPFMKPAHGIEAFGIKTHKTPDRPFYFRQLNNDWIAPEEFFKQTWKEFNRVS